ncbi:MAG: hypothetical protein EXR93_09515 [Gemmatimonadetes bacterium]|nr:hypothetical protein [Gemmatimonadota bacterium]
MPTPGPSLAAKDRPRVFLDCGFHCDFDHLRREIGFVDWVRDRADADVHALGTEEDTGGGGSEFTFTLIGLKGSAGRRDTLHFVSKSTDTEAEKRVGLTKALSLGLVRFSIGFNVADRITVTYAAPTGAAAAPKVQRDPWNFWVFRVRVGGYMNGEQRQGSLSFNGGVDANRVTERLKININTNGNYQRNSYDLDSVTTYTSSKKNYSQQLLVVGSLGGHWSAGFRQRANKSTFNNQDLALEAGPAVEYDIYPYKESSHRQFTFTYMLGVTHLDYQETTVYGKLWETLPLHRLAAALSAKQTWGSVEMSLNATQYLHDLAKHRINLFGGFDVRLLKGLTFNAYGEVARIKDQLNLAASGLTPEEILLQQRQQGTDYSYWANFGLSYSFGSIFNNVVNPRMD